MINDQFVVSDRRCHAARRIDLPCQRLQNRREAQAVRVERQSFPAASSQRNHPPKIFSTSDSREFQTHLEGGPEWGWKIHLVFLPIAWRDAYRLYYRSSHGRDGDVCEMSSAIRMLRGGG